MREEAELLGQKLRAVREHVGVQWEEHRVERLLHRTKALRRRRRVVRGASAVAAIAIGATIAAWTSAREAPLPTAPVASVESTIEAPRPIRLADGSVVTPLTADTEVVVVRVDPQEVRLDVVRGAARFEVTEGLDRTFGVTAGSVEVTVVGTVFEVTREGDAARVRVVDGRVRVRWPVAQERLLEAGEEARFSPTPAGGTDDADARARAEPREPPAEPRLARESIDRSAEPRPPAARRAEPAERPAWIEHAERGDYEAARRLLEADGGGADLADLELLMLASDTMRLTGRPDRALELLDRATEAADGDPRASLVAFTRGRLLLTALDRPRDAAADFARARELSPQSALAMDALAREVEALSRAGDADGARQKAELYVELYPHGLRLSAVRRWGQLP